MSNSARGFLRIFVIIAICLMAVDYGLLSDRQLECTQDSVMNAAYGKQTMVCKSWRRGMLLPVMYPGRSYSIQIFVK